MRPITAAGIAFAAAISIVTAAHAQQSTKPQTPPEKIQAANPKQDANTKNPTATTEKPQTTRTAQRRRNYAHVRHRVLPKCDAWAMSNFGVCW